MAFRRFGAFSFSVLTRRYLSSQSSGSSIPRRAMLYCPGFDERKIQGAIRAQPDSIILNCEDGVALNKKQESRDVIAKALNEFDFGVSEATVRPNSVASGLLAEDLEMILNKVKKTPRTILLPKVDSFDDILQFSELFANASKAAKHSIDAESISLIIYTESARGLLNLEKICDRFVTELDDSYFQLDGIVFGSDDYCASIGATRTVDAQEVLTARQRIVTIAKAFEVQAIDMVHIDLKDAEGLRSTTEKSAQMGFTGRQVIHPKQVDIVHKAYLPSEERLEWAAAVIEAYSKHRQETGEGVFTFRNQMIDQPLIKQAENILQVMKMLQDRHDRQK